MKIFLFLVIAIVLYVLYKRSIKRIDTNTPIDFTSRGLHKFKQRNYQGAIDDYSKAIQLNSEDWIAYNNRGNTYSVLLHDAITNEEKLRLIELAMSDLRASLEIKSPSEGNVKATSHLTQLQKEKELIFNTTSRMDSESTRTSESYDELDTEDIDHLMNLAQLDVDDEDTRFQKLQEDNPNVTRAFTDILKSIDERADNEDAVIRLNKTMESINKSNPQKAIPVDETAEFGLSFDNPILVSNVLNGYNYLGDLRTVKGNPITYERQGAEINSNGAHIDKYEIYEEGEYITDLYINCYGSTNSKLVPRGFTHRSLGNVGNNQAATPEMQEMMNDVVNSLKSMSAFKNTPKDKTSIESLVQPLCDYRMLSFAEMLFRKSVVELTSSYANKGLIDLTSEVANLTKWRFALFLARMMKLRLMAESNMDLMNLINQDFKRLLHEYLLFHLAPKASNLEKKALSGEQYFDITLVNLSEDIQYYWKSKDSNPLVQFLFPTVSSREAFKSKFDFDGFHEVLMDDINRAFEFCMSRLTNS